MADDPPKNKGERHNSFEDTSFVIGKRADGTIDSFPLSELPERARQADIESRAWDDAIAQMEGGFAELEAEDEPDDLSDLDQVVGLFGGG